MPTTSTGCMVNGDVPLPDGRMLRLYFRITHREGDTSIGGFSGSIQIINSPEYLDRPAVTAMKFPTPGQCYIELEGRIGRTRSTVNIDLFEGVDTVMVNAWKGSVPYITMPSPVPIRSSNAVDEVNEYVTLYPPVVEGNT